MTHITRNKLLKTIISLALIFALTVVGLNVAAVGQNMVVSVADITAAPGESATLDVTISDNPGELSSMIIGITYDTTALELDMNSVANGKVFSNLTKGMNLVWYDANGVDTNDVLVTLAFNVKDNAKSGEYAVSVVVYECYDINEEDVAVDVVSGSITVACPHTNTTNVSETPADCDENGFTAGVYCNDCETYISGHEVIPATGKHVDADSKWESDVDNHYHTCDCGEIIDTAKHSGGDAGCTEKAVCAVCGTTYGTVSPSKHGETEIRNASEATCAKDGYTGDTYCKDCGEKIKNGSVIPATGEHVDADGKWESDADNHFHTCGCGAEFDSAAHSGGTATCTEKAACSVCGAEYGTVDPSKHGEIEMRDSIEATCAKDGYTGDTFCKDCGEKIAKGSVIPATGDHVDADGKWESDAHNHYHTCECGEIIDSAAHTGGTATCVSKAECEACGAEYGDVDANNHNEETRDAVAATEESEGYTGDTYCKDCGEKLADGEVTPKLDHTHAMEKTDKKDATHEADGNIEYYTCSKCGKLYKDEAGAQEITIDETVIAKGKHTYETDNNDDKHWEECACGSKINEAAHTYGDWNETKAPTATEKGSKERTCSVCGHKQVEELPKIEEELPPQTGDTAMITSLVAVAAVMAIAIVFRKKRIHG